DFGVSFTPEQLAAGKVVYNYEPVESESEDLSGISVFYRDEAGAIFHTYSTFGRGDELLSAAYAYLDLAPKGRDEDSLPFPSALWLRLELWEDRGWPRLRAASARYCSCSTDWTEPGRALRTRSIASRALTPYCMRMSAATVPVRPSPA